MMYEAPPPALSSLLGRIGGIGESAIATIADSTITLRSNSAAISAANAGMITFIASRERISRPGRCSK